MSNDTAVARDDLEVSTIRQFAGYDSQSGFDSLDRVDEEGASDLDSQKEEEEVLLNISP